MVDNFSVEMLFDSWRNGLKKYFEKYKKLHSVFDNN